jgi:hypothetical protein
MDLDISDYVGLLVVLQTAVGILEQSQVNFVSLHLSIDGLH